MRINLIDNSYNRNSDGEKFIRDEIAALLPIQGKTIRDLCNENENLLIFPYSLSDTDDRIGDQPILNINNTSDKDRATIGTNNIMGFLGVGNLQIKIKSRFDQNRDDYFLHYMLQKVMSFNLFDLNHNNTQEDVFDFIMFMFP